MISCFSKNQLDSSSKRIRHFFNYMENDKQHLHIKLFKDNKNNIKILLNEEEIEKEFLYHQKTKEREEKIKQYIGIPLMATLMNNGEEVNQVFALLQIDTETPYGFGKTYDEVLDFANNIIKPFSRLLITSYEIEQILICTCKKYAEIGQELTNNNTSIKSSINEHSYVIK